MFLLLQEMDSYYMNTTNTTLFIRGIIPGTTYNVIVVAVAMGDTIGLVESEPSDVLTFMTMRGGNCSISMCVYMIYLCYILAHCHVSCSKFDY